MMSDASDASSSSMEPLRSARVRTISTSSASSSDSEYVAPVAPRLPPVARGACVLRAPCLKRNASAPPPSSSSSGSTSRPAVGPHEAAPTLALAALTSVSVGRPRVAPMCSFAAPRSFSAAAPPRSVRFDDAPPEHGLTHSGRHYDRTPIECTRNGSEHDLSLKHSVTYGRDDDDEASAPESSSDECARRGKARWASLKNGTVIGSAVHESTVPRAGEPTEPNGCSLPVHGVRSFGGLGAKAGSMGSLYASSVEDDSLDEATGLDDDDDGDSTLGGTAKSRKPDPFAALRPRTKSPDATPRQSPSVRCRWENVQDYFAVAADDGDGGDDESSSKPARAAAVSPQRRAASPSGSRLPDAAHGALADDEGEALRRSILLAASSKSRRSAASPRASPRGSPRRSPRDSPRESRASSPQPASPSVVSPPLPTTTASSAAHAAELSSAVEALAVSVDAPAEATPSASEAAASLSPFSGVCSPSAGGSSSGMPLFLLDSSPMSSRCSSTDPWSGVSSDETDSALPDSPSGGWGSSSCTSPDLTPADIAARVSSAVDKVLVSQQQQPQDSVLAATLPSPPSPEHDGTEARLPPSVLAECHLTPSSSRPSALRSRRAASNSAKMTLSADNSPLLWPADDDGSGGSGGSASVTPVPGAAPSSSKPKKKGCTTKRRTRASFSESAFSAGGFDEGALGGF